MSAVRKSRVKLHVVGVHDKAMLADIARSGLTDKDATAMRLEAVDPAWAKEHTNWERSGYVIRYFDVGGNPTEFFRIKWTDGNRSGFGAAAKELPKYWQQPASGIHPYLPPNVDWNKLCADPTRDLIITEGEKKAYAASKAGFPTIGLGGVNSSGNKKRDIDLLPELKLLARHAESGRSRNITVIFDSDTATKDEVVTARRSLQIELWIAGANVFDAAIEAHLGMQKIGLDDLIVGSGPSALKELIATRRAVGIRLVVAWAREIKKHRGEGADRNRLVGEVVRESFRRGGTFIRAGARLMYFDNESKTVLNLDDHRDRTLRAFIEQRTGVSGACPEWATVYEHLANECKSGGTEAKVSRLSRYDSANHTLYVAQSDSQMFRVTERGWDVVPNGTANVFMDTGAKLDPVKPATRKASKAAFNHVAALPNFVDGEAMSAKQARMLWSLFLFAPFFPDLLPTRFIPLFNGAAGSGKTTGGRAFIQTIYGPQANVSGVDHDRGDSLDATLVNNPVVVLDNVDGKYPNLENRLAVAATSGNLERRKFYTELGQKLFVIDCFVIATSRNPSSFSRDDVVDRLLYLKVERRTGFRAEYEIQQETAGNRENWWRYMLDTLPSVIGALRKVRPSAVHDDRMADFSRFAQAVGTVLGYTHAEIVTALTAMAKEKHRFMADYSIIVSALDTLLLDWESQLRFGKQDKKKYDEVLADIQKPRTAAELMKLIKTSQPKFPFERAATFATSLHAEKKAVEARFDWKDTYDKHNKVHQYVLKPKKGWPTFDEVKRDA